MFYDRTSPWQLKAAVVAVFLLTRCPSVVFRPAHQAALPLAVQVCMLAPSLLLSVHNRRRTTTLLVETALMVAGVSVVLHMGATGYFTVLEATLVLHMCTMHVLFTQGVELQRARRLLVGETLCAWASLVGSLALPAAMIMQTPGGIPDTRAAVLALFSGEVLGTGAAMAARLLLTVADGYEDVMTRRE